MVTDPRDMFGKNYITSARTVLHVANPDTVMLYEHNPADCVRKARSQQERYPDFTLGCLVVRKQRQALGMQAASLTHKQFG